MAETTSLPDAVWSALREIASGNTRASDCESERLDFKEDPAVHPRDKNPDTHLIDTLRDECVCLANGPAAESHIILGVNDRTTGPEAFTGTQRDPRWIQQKIFTGTVPPMHTEVTAFPFGSARLIAITIPRALCVYTRTRGQATYRVGATCQPLDAATRRRLEHERANPDFTAQTTDLTVDDLDPAALQSVRQKATRRRLMSGDDRPVPTPTLLMLEELGVARRENDVVRLTEAARILFVPPTAPNASVRYLWRPFPGAEPQVEHISEPLALAIDTARHLISRNSSSEIARTSFSDGTELPVPAFPHTVVDEALSNAFAHRDYNYVSPITIEHSPRVLSITSPGGLPAGVEVNRVLTTHSIPRNPTLMGALRRMGLVEETSRGFDRMWLGMLSTGRDAPEIDASSEHVTIRIAAGNPDISFIRGLHQLADTHQSEEVYNYQTLILLWHLYQHRSMTESAVRTQTQTSELQARELLDWLTSDVRLLSLNTATRRWILAPDAARALSLPPTASAAVNPANWIAEHFDDGEQLSARQIAEALQLDREVITGILRDMRNAGKARIVPDGPQRGPGALWEKVPTSL
ncbi:MAG: ATP-binding protein [Actinomycetaceae bacterium]|nr:ATP-binding protein [Actinomycetaceae bacterium]MDU0969890.1 ATP-binding protein [Actinomycetaceae bacterium]